MTQLQKFAKAERGSTAIEFALIFPLMIVLYFGMIDLTQLVSFNRKITSIADSVVNLVGQNRHYVLKTNMQDYFQVAGMIMKPEPGSDVRIRVFGYRHVGSTLVNVWKVDSGSGATCSGNPTNARLAGLATSGRDLVVAQVCYNFVPIMGSILDGSIFNLPFLKVEQIAIQTPRSTQTLDCFLAVKDDAGCGL